jgi:hypothetical protein
MRLGWRSVGLQSTSIQSPSETHSSHLIGSVAEGTADAILLLQLSVYIGHATMERVLTCSSTMGSKGKSGVRAPSRVLHATKPPTGGSERRQSLLR